MRRSRRVRDVPLLAASVMGMGYGEEEMLMEAPIRLHHCLIRP